MDLLEILQRDVTGLLLTVPELVYTPVVPARPRLDADDNIIAAPDLEDKINRLLKGITAQNGKAGTVIIVQMPEESILDDVMGGSEVACTARLVVRVEENLKVNLGAIGTGLSCETIANHIFANLHDFNFASIALRGDIRNGKKPYQYRDGVLGYECHFEGQWTRPLPTRCFTPVISIDGGVVTITCATPGASIYFTINGNFPRSGGPGSALYTDPFTQGGGSGGNIVTEGGDQIVAEDGSPLVLEGGGSISTVNVRAVAYKSGLAASFVASQTGS